MGNNPHFDIDVERGELGENLLKDILEGKVEVKTDYRAKETGNYYVEYKQYNSDYESWSGISITEAKWWAWVCPLPTKLRLFLSRRFVKLLKITGGHLDTRGNRFTTIKQTPRWGFLFPLLLYIKYN